MNGARVGAFGIPAATVAVALWDPARHGGPPLCPWHALTGRACPGCGLTRAAGALLRGRIDEALHIHPLVLVVAAQVAVVWVLCLLALRRRVPTRRPTPAWVTPLVIVEAALFLGVWGTRLATGSLPTA
jgi:hypothetical protein